MGPIRGILNVYEQGRINHLEIFNRLGAVQNVSELDDKCILDELAKFLSANWYPTTEREWELFVIMSIACWMPDTDSSLIAAWNNQRRDRTRRGVELVRSRLAQSKVGDKHGDQETVAAGNATC